MNGYPDFVEDFLRIKNPHNLSAEYDYVRMFELTPTDVPALTRLAVDAGFLCGDEATTPPEFFWLPVHAWRALAQLGAAESLDALWSLLRLPRNESVNRHLPAAFLAFGTDVVLDSLVRNLGVNDWSDHGFEVFVETLDSLARRGADARRRVEEFLEDRFERHYEQPAHFNGHLARLLCRFGVVRRYDAIFDGLLDETIDPGVFSPEEFLFRMRGLNDGAVRTAAMIDELTENFGLGALDPAEINEDFLLFDDFWAASAVQRGALRFVYESLGAAAFARLAADVNRLQRVPFLYCLSENVFGRLEMILRLESATGREDGKQFGDALGVEEQRALRHLVRYLRLLFDHSAEPVEDFFFLFSICYSQLIGDDPPARADFRLPPRIAGLLRKLVEVPHEEAHILLENMEDETNTTGRLDLSIVISLVSQEVCRLLSHSALGDDDDFFENNQVIEDGDGPFPFDRFSDPKPRKC